MVIHPQDSCHISVAVIQFIFPFNLITSFPLKCITFNEKILYLYFEFRTFFSFFQHQTFDQMKNSHPFFLCFINRNDESFENVFIFIQRILITHRIFHFLSQAFEIVPFLVNVFFYIQMVFFLRIIKICMLALHEPMNIK